MDRGFTVHYAPDEGPLCSSDYPEEALTENHDDVTGCTDCLELVAEALADHNECCERCTGHVPLWEGRVVIKETRTRLPRT